MQKALRSSLFVLSAALAFGASAPLALAATTPSLGVAATFSALAHTFTSTTIPYGANIFGDLGYATTTGVSVGVSGGVTHVNDATYLQAGADQHTALAALNSQACTFNFVGAVDLATDVSHGPIGVYTPGVYCSSGPMSIGGAGTVSFSGAGTYIFRPSDMLTTSDFSIATTTNGASPCDVFWTPKWPTPSVATALGLDTRFVGTVIEPVGAANSSITVGGGTKWVGRALAFDWGITTNPVIMKYVSITAPTCPVLPPPVPTTATLHIIKHVINNNGGTATASSFTLHVKGSGMGGVSDIAGSPAAGVESPGTSYTVDAGTYTVSENAFSGYTGSMSGDCDASGNVTLVAGDNKTCTITNDDIAPPPPATPTPGTLHVIKHVINNNGGTATASSFTLHVKGSTGMGIADVAGSPAAGVESPGTAYTLDAGTYTVSENAFSGYTGSISGDCDGSGNVTLASGGNAICTITNDDIIVPAVVPPVIHITKIPTPLALPLGPGPVTYDYTVTNIGTIVMTNVTVTDNKCAPAIFISGDTNADTNLDVSETWKYRCSATLATTTTNTVITTGHGNGLTATDTTDATVIVGVPPVVTPPVVTPKLPNTGFPPREASTPLTGATVETPDQAGDAPVALGAGAIAAIIWSTATASDLGVTSVGTLPTSSFYFLKEWGRGISRFFTFGSIAKAQLELNITNDKAAELLEVQKAYDACAANALGGSKQCKPGDKVGSVKNALQNFTNAQDRLNTQLSNLTATSTNPKVADLLTKVDEKTAKQAALLEQLTQTWNSTGAGEQNITDAIDKAQNNTLKTFAVTVTSVNDAPSLKQKAEEQIKRAGIAIVTVDVVSPTGGEVDLKVTVPKQTQGDTFGEKTKAPGSISGKEMMDAITVAKAKSNLESAKKAFADGKYGEAYGQARSAEAMVPVLATGENFPDKKVETTTPTTTSAETKTKLNTNTNKEPVKVLENNSPLPIEQKDVPKPTSTTTESTPKKIETSQSPVIDPTSTSLLSNSKENTSESTGTPQSSESSAGPVSNYNR